MFDKLVLRLLLSDVQKMMTDKKEENGAVPPGKKTPGLLLY